VRELPLNRHDAGWLADAARKYLVERDIADPIDQAEIAARWSVDGWIAVARIADPNTLVPHFPEMQAALAAIKEAAGVA
jgi:hypothetical protein